MTCRIGVLVSGRGSNLEAILKAIRGNFIKHATVDVVISNKPGVRALDIAKNYGVKTLVIESTGLDRAAYDEKIAAALISQGVEPPFGLVLLAGYMRLLTPEFIERFAGRVMNIHPSLLPSFPGLNAQQQALERGVKVTGCTVHFVIPDVDAGPIILQRAVDVMEGDNVEALSSRILKQEHAIYPLAVKLFVEGKLSVSGSRVGVRP